MVVKETRGRPRKRVPNVPAHIDAGKLPDYCYWDPSGKGHWYTKFVADEKPRRKRIAGPEATLADLHKAMEVHAGKDTDNLNWLWGLFQESPQFKKLAQTSRDDYEYCQGVVSNHPTKKQGIAVGKIPLTGWSQPMVQKLIDQISNVNGPSAAAHGARYLRRLFNWAANRGYVKVSPVGKLEMPKERKQRRLPAKDVVGNLIVFAQERGKLKPHTRGSCAPYIWKALVFAPLCRLRGVEVRSLSDASLIDDGVLCARRKGSNDNITRTNKTLDLAIRAAQAERAAIWEGLSKPVPFKPEDRPLLVTQDGDWISQTTWQSAWQRFMKLAIAAKIITAEQRFGLHDMKRRGVTDTKGTKQEKMLASGHNEVSMLDVYDFEVPIVDAAGELPIIGAGSD